MLQLTSKQVYLTLCWAGVVTEACFIAGAFGSGALSLHGFTANQYISTFAPVTILISLRSIFLVGWWLANRHAGVPCYPEVACISYSHMISLAILLSGALLVIFSGQVKNFLSIATFAPLLGESVILTGLLIHLVRNFNRKPQPSPC